ncbi:MAG: Holliday junction resolvase RuvX [bacterium]
MGRILAIDYGRKRVGLAVTDERKIIATALGTVHATEVFRYLTEYLSGHEVECFVIGEPKEMTNIPSEAEKYIIPFLRILRKTFPGIRIERFDERFTSRMAVQAIRDSGIRKKQRQNKALIDSVSATLILQSYLESITLKK